MLASMLAALALTLKAPPTRTVPPSLLRAEESLARAAERSFFTPPRPRDRLGHLGPYTPLRSAPALALLRGEAGCERLDRAGIPVVQYETCTVDDVPPEPFVNPGSVAMFGLRLYDLGPRYRPLFLVEAAWLLHHQQRDGLLPVPFPIPMLGLKAGWSSAMYQGLAISLFLRAYQVTGRRVYLTAARRAVDAFLLPYDRGGVVAETPYGPWPQEYAAPRPPSVLNGGLTALFGLYEYQIFTGRPFPALRSYLATLRRMLPALTVPGWARYQLAGDDLASPFYMAIQTAELYVLADYSHDRLFAAWARRWQSDFQGPGKVQAAILRAQEHVLDSAQSPSPATSRTRPPSGRGSHTPATFSRT